ncbi:MAG: hypothetical protein GC151_15270 [Betaproteobacteria bacterium]|nr:hypothetical protein [Betaproteobacteria bacterium]
MMTSSMFTNAVAQRSNAPGVWEASFFEQVFRARSSDARGIPDRTTHARARLDDHAVSSPAAVRAEVATTREQLVAATELVRQRYEWRGYETGSIDVEPETGTRAFVTLVTFELGHVIGTMTLTFDGPTGLCIDHTYPDVISAARENGRTLCELTRLAVAPNSDSRRVLSSMFALAYKIGRVERGATDLYIEVNPRHAPVYRKLFGFTVASDVRECGRVKAPAILLRLDIEKLDGELATYMGRTAATLAEFDSESKAHVSLRDDTRTVVATS